jgi:hypothetical protein
LFTKEEGGCAKQFQILCTEPLEGVDDYCTRVERSYFGHCNNKTAGCVDTPPGAWGRCGGGGVIKDEKLKLLQKFLIRFKIRENFQELEQ